jgi:uncharacterized glyoxalase superfamily protein PhnB
MNVTDSGQFLVKYTQDIPAICQFYASLGYEPTDVTDDLATVALGGHEIHFVRAETEPFEQYRYISSNDTSGANDMILYVESTDIDSDYNTVSKTTAKLRSSIVTNHWGAKEFLLQDPSGLNIAIYQMVA